VSFLNDSAGYGVRLILALVKRGTQAASGTDRIAELVREAHALVHETARERDKPGGIERWHAALFELDKAMRLLYPPALRNDIEHLASGDSGAIDTAIRFLEDDPWAFGTGYTKERILGRLKLVDLSPAQAGRLRAVILARVDGPYRREFRRFCLLAPRVANTAFRQTLVDRLRSGDSGTRIHALWVLEALHQPLTGDERMIAQLAIEELAAGPFAARASGWLSAAVHRHADPAWLDGLIGRATARDKAGRDARRVLGMASLRPTAVQRERLTAIALAGVRGEIATDWSWQFWSLADSPELRAGLLEAYRASGDDDRRRELERVIERISRWSRGTWPGDAL
jgi:hypothetical protein